MTNVAQLPICACRDKCKFPELPRASGHHCPGCKLAIHAVCGVLDDTAGLDDSNWCYECYDLKKSKKRPPPTHTPRTSATNDLKSPHKKSPVPNDLKSPHKKSPVPKSSKLKNKIVLPKQAAIIDPFVRKRVAFHLDGRERPSWLLNDAYVNYGKSVASRLYLFGIILRRDKATKIACTYRVEWEHTALGESIIDINVLQPAIELARKLQQVVDEESKHPIGGDVLRFLRDNDGSTPGAVIPSDDEGEDADDEDDEKDDNTEPENADENLINFAFPSLRTTTEQQDGLMWATNTSCSPSFGTYDETKRSSIKPELKSKFVNPLSSFLAFLPLEFWKLFVFETNRYAARRQSEATSINGGPRVNWASPLTLNEMFTFMGILIQMTMRPTPGQTYTCCWQDKNWHPYTERMPLRRFQAIRGMLHMSENGLPENSSNDALYKVRPLLNVLKKTLGHYLVPGSDLALDETSVACRSKYGRNLIFYNSTKPGGKYHFRFYALCDSDTYSCLRIVIHTRNASDKADGYNSGTTEVVPEEQDERINEFGKTTQLVMDIARPFYHTGRVINMDRYYTSPEVFLQLRKEGLFARGTCMTNRRMFPQVVTFSDVEARKERRGTCRLAVNKDNNLVAIGWIDGNPVHLITTVDGTEMSFVNRRVQQAKQQQSAPTAVRKYGHGMQAVDRFDQLMSLFSLAKRHCFKKWYLKLAMALLDVGMINAEIHYFMLHPEEKKGMYRYNYREQLCSQLFDTEWSQYESMTNTDVMESIREGREDESQEATSISQGARNDCVDSCTPLMANQYLRSEESPVKSYNGICCQVCLFEGRKTRTKSVAYCVKHGIRACLTTPNLSSFSNDKYKNAVLASTDEELSLWRCPAESMSCWIKAHSFYIERGLWGQSNTSTTTNNKQNFRHCGVRISSELYQNKEEWMVKHGLINTKGAPRGRKSKKCGTISKTVASQPSTDSDESLNSGPDNLSHVVL